MTEQLIMFQMYSSTKMCSCTLWAIILNMPTDLTLVSWRLKTPFNQRLTVFIGWHSVVNCATLKSDVWVVETCLMCLVGGRWINWRRSTGEKERIYRWWKNRERKSTKLTGYTIFSAQNRFVHKTRGLIFLTYEDLLHLFYCNLGLNGEFHHIQRLWIIFLSNTSHWNTRDRQHVLPIDVLSPNVGSKPRNRSRAWPGCQKVNKTLL